MDDHTRGASAYAALLHALRANPKRWLVTGAAGFIGSNLVEALLRLGQRVTGMDNFATGHQHNLDQVRALVGEAAWANFDFAPGDIRVPEDCARACEGGAQGASVDYVLHQAALGSVARSIEDPAATNATNVGGFLNMLTAARDAKVRRFVYAASSSTYGDHPALPKIEEQIGRPLSPYAVTKYVNELYAEVFARCYGMDSIGLRYFNVFGPRQDPNGAYAAVIPQWVAALIADAPVRINGDGETSRDFCYIDNVIQANLLAACSTDPEAANQVYNVALNERTSLKQLHAMMCELLAPRFPRLREHTPEFTDFRPGDVRHSQANIDKARKRLGYEPTHRIDDGLAVAMDWYVDRLGTQSVRDR